MSEIHTSISEEPLDVGSALEAVADPGCGGIALFVGTVRATSSTGERSGSDVVGLEYDAHPSLAPERLRDVAEQAAQKWPLAKIVAVHRTGSCALGEPTVVVACSAPHRGDALDACRWMIDTIKSSVPIWKREVFADGSAWVEPQGVV